MLSHDLFDSPELTAAIHGLIIAGVGYIAYWLRSKIGHPNGRGPITKQLNDIHSKLEETKNVN